MFDLRRTVASDGESGRRIADRWKGRGGIVNNLRVPQLTDNERPCFLGYPEVERGLFPRYFVAAHCETKWYARMTEHQKFILIILHAVELSGRASPLYNR